MGMGMPQVLCQHQRQHRLVGLVCTGSPEAIARALVQAVLGPGVAREGSKGAQT